MGFSFKVGNKNGLRRRKEKHASRNGFVSGMNCLPHFTIALRRWFTSAAYRPAGTREALPGTICGTCVPHFLGGHTRKWPSWKFELTNGEIRTWLMAVGLKRGAACCAPTWKL